MKKDPSKIRFYTCDERGHFAINCPMNKNGSKKKKNSKRRHHSHTAEDDDPPRKRVKQESEDSSSDLRICSDLHSHGNCHTWKQILAY